MSNNEARQRLQETIERWIKGAIRRQGPVVFSGGHDELNFAASWPRFARAIGDEETLAFCKRLRDQLINWPGLVHGFYPDASWDIEHSVENWTVFVTSLSQADPDDSVTIECLEHVAHHLGNWEPGVPAWFDWEKQRFVSEHVGTEAVRDYPPYDYSTYWDARASELALTVFDLTGNKRYLEFAEAFARGWADHTLAQPGLGYWLMLDTDIQDRELFKRRYNEEYPEDFQSRNVNWMLECCRHLLHVYERTQVAELSRAARKMLELGPKQSTRPLAAYDAVKRDYQRITGDTCFTEEIASYEQALVEAAEQSLSEPLPQMVILAEVPKDKKWWTPAARRFQAYYGKDDAIIASKALTPSDLLTAASLSKDSRFSIRAIEQATKELALCDTTLRDGRDHGCDGRYLHGAGKQAVQIFLATGKG